MVILASRSPRRQALLKRIYDDFECRPTDCDETPSTDKPAVLQVMEIAVRKARAAQKESDESDLIIAADTSVEINGISLGKPRDGRDAAAMLHMLSGKMNTVHTGVCVIHRGKIYGLTESTDVFFYTLTDAEIERYVGTDEPLDKAGAYGIQGQGALLVRRVEGDFYNACGLPIAALNRLLRDIGAAE